MKEVNHTYLLCLQFNKHLSLLSRRHSFKYSTAGTMALQTKEPFGLALGGCGARELVEEYCKQGNCPSESTAMGKGPVCGLGIVRKPKRP